MFFFVSRYLLFSKNTFRGLGLEVILPQLLESVLAHMDRFGMTMKCVAIDHQDILLQGLQPRSCHILSFYFSYPFIFPILYSLPPHFGLVVTNGQWFVEIAIFYTLRKLFCGLMCEMSEKIYNSTFRVKISLLNIIFWYQMEK